MYFAVAKLVLIQVIHLEGFKLGSLASKPTAPLPEVY